MADRKFGQYQQAMYIDIPSDNYYTAADDPKKLGFRSVSGTYYKGDSPYTGFAPMTVEAGFWLPTSPTMLFINGIAAQGLINDKFYIHGVEATPQQIQELPVQTITAVAGQLATLGLRTPTGRGEEGKFVRDAAAEKKFAEDYRKQMAMNLQTNPRGFGNPRAQFGYGAIPGYTEDADYLKYWANASDEEIINLVGGVNAEGTPGSAFGINSLLPVGGATWSGAQLTATGMPASFGGTSGSRFGAPGSMAEAPMSYVAEDGREFSSESALKQYESSIAKRASRQSAFEDLRAEMAAIGLAALVDPLRGLIEQDVSPSEFAIKLRETEAYQKRFIANQARIEKNLRALTPGEYIKIEDAYRQTLRSYGLNQFDNDQYVAQFIANDISPGELSSRVSLAVQRVQNADPTIAATLRDYYGIGQQDLVAYVLDPKQQLPKLEQKVTAAEIGAAARVQGIQSGMPVAEQLAAQGVTQEQAKTKYAAIASILPAAEKLSQIYGATMEGYDLGQAEQEVFNQLASAQRRRERLVQREVAEFSGQSGLGKSSLGSEIKGTF